MVFKKAQWLNYNFRRYVAIGRYRQTLMRLKTRTALLSYIE